jgi:hypothetical protein
VVYRNLRPDEDPANGLTAKNPNANYLPGGHVTNGSKVNFASQFISTTKSIAVANKWTAGRMVEIDLDKYLGQVLDLSTPEGRAANGVRGATAARLAGNSAEVLLKGDVPPDAISWVLGGPC